MEIAYYILIFFTGGCIASAARCMNYRIRHGMDWVHGRSVCESCGRQLRWYELVPVVSCLVLRGKCRSCGHKFGYSHAAQEALVGATSMFFYWYNHEPFSIGMLTFWLSFLVSSYIASVSARRSKK